ncbi:hypothetical protein GJ744_007653 [Endocarpon pusillum]|uniref:Methyltransferase domain-containing protein n=1 Tax=Endocarpon pusillum TaxID=364733 RepID=A0A8H7AR51_9EURO|nr:hypothetical protein GJ744_007653 [Endocarpon pusillum]
MAANKSFFQVRALTRNPDSTAAQALNELGITPVLTDGWNQEQMVKALDGVWGLSVNTNSEDPIFRDGSDHTEFALGKIIVDSALKAGVHDDKEIAPVFGGFPHFLDDEAIFTFCCPRWGGEENVPWLSVSHDFGDTVHEIFLDPVRWNGKVIHGASHLASFDVLTNAFQEGCFTERKGIACVIRPDGYIGTIADLEDIDKVEQHSEKCIIKKSTSSSINTGANGLDAIVTNGTKTTSHQSYAERCMKLPPCQAKFSRNFYDEWAPEYNKDAFSSDVGYIGLETLAKTFVRHVDVQGAEILEAGCGTGLGGVALAKHGATVIDVVDISSGMLREAVATKVYRRLLQDDFSKQLPLPAHSYDAVFCLGALGVGHIGPEALVEFARLTKPGGKTIVNVDGDSWKQCGFDVEVDRLVGSTLFKALWAEWSAEAEGSGSKSRDLVLEQRLQECYDIAMSRSYPGRKKGAKEGSSSTFVNVPPPPNPQHHPIFRHEALVFAKVRQLDQYNSVQHSRYRTSTFGEVL